MTKELTFEDATCLFGALRLRMSQAKVEDDDDVGAKPSETPHGYLALLIHR